MQQQNWFGLVKLVMLVGALVVANVFVAQSAKDLEAQGCPPSDPCSTTPEGDNRKCTFPQPLPGNTCEEYPGFSCSIATCTETALEP